VQAGEKSCGGFMEVEVEPDPISILITRQTNIGGWPLHWTTSSKRHAWY